MKRKKKKRRPNNFYSKLREQFPELSEDTIRMRLNRGTDEKIIKAAKDLKEELKNKAAEIKKLIKQT